MGLTDGVKQPKSFGILREPIEDTVEPSVFAYAANFTADQSVCTYACMEIFMTHIK